MKNSVSQGQPRVKVVILLGIFVVLALSLLIWRWRSDKPDHVSTVEFRVPILATSALQTLDPIKSVELVQYNLDLQIFECLVGVGQEGAIIPALAERWESSADFKVWTFHLREARFSEDESFGGNKSRQVTVDDVIYSWKRGLNPKLGSLNSFALSTSVVGANSFAKGESETVAGLKKIDDRTLEVELTEPDRDFLTRLTVLSTAVVAPEAVARYGEQFGSHPVGTGPFKLKNWISGEYLVLERNPSYGQGNGWQPKAAAVEQVRFTFFRSEPQIAKAFDDGLIDVRDIAGADLAQLTNIGSLDELQRLHTGANLIRPGKVCNLHLLAPIVGKEYVFGDSAALRRSLTASFNHQQLMTSAVGPLGTATKTLMLPPGILVDGMLTADESTPPPADPSSEASLRGRTVKVAYVSSRIGDVTVGLLQKWIEQRGGKVRLYPSASINALFASVGEVKPDLTLIYWSPYYPNLSNFLTALLTSSRPVPNFTGFSNIQLDQAAQRLKVATGDELRQVHLTVKNILDQEMPWIPLYYETPLVLVKPNVQKFRINPVSVMLLTDVEVDSTKGAKERSP